LSRSRCRAGAEKRRGGLCCRRMPPSCASSIPISGSTPGLRLADFDVLAQLAAADGELRMTELAARTLISRSGLTRRVAMLVEEGLLRRANATDDGRGVIVALTDAGVVRVTETVPVHLRGVSKLFVERLDDHELAVLETALRKVIVDCTFG
jgi:DNA-binding MarR family transcriptional regulator